MKDLLIQLRMKDKDMVFINSKINFSNTKENFKMEKENDKA